MLALVAVPIPHAAVLGPISAVAFLVAFLSSALITARKPALGLVAFIITEPFEFAVALGPTTVSLPKVVTIGLVVGLALRRSSLAPLRRRMLRPLLGGAIALVLVTALTLLPATFLDPTLRETFKALDYLALLCIGIVAFSADPDERAIRRAVLTSVTVVIVSAIVQEFTVAPSGFIVNGRTVARIAGLLEGPNQLAGWLGFTLPILAAYALLQVRSRTDNAIAIIGVITVALTYSRAGAVGVAVGLAFLAVLAYRRGSRNVIRRVVLALALTLFVSAIPLAAAKTGIVGATHRFSGFDEQAGENGLASRGVLWRAALQMAARDPGLGVGAGNFEYLTPTVGLVGVRTHANSLYLQALAEGGIALLSALVWTTVAALVVLLRAPRSTLALGIAAGTIALATHQIFDTLVFYPKIGDLWWLLLGIGAARATAPSRNGIVDS